MTILITGATGVIGRALTQTLLSQSAEVRVITRRPHRVLQAFEAYRGRVLAFEWHPRTEPFPPEALEGVERVIHLMGEPIHAAATRQARQRVEASRRIATRRLAEALGRQKVHLIVASSASVYGFGAGPPVTESSALARPKSKLALSLVGCEEEAEQIAAGGSTVTAVRLGLVITPGGFPDPLRQLHAAGLTWRTPHPDAVLPVIDLQDAVALLAWLARARRVAGPVHAVTPEPLRSADLKALLEEATPRRVRVPLPRLALRRYIGALADVVHNRQHIVPQRLLDAGFEFEHPNPLDSVHAALSDDVALPAPWRPSLIADVLQRAGSSTEVGL
ncbi:MAG TPA: DUF1731 domain-containing protein [Hyphomicrobiaceae bacterium]|jgi:uncharacterized protein (TIGR01777 family)|nr:DUF1731 domain-containing protein [Hyphomicrobiaceae bacterium]